LVRKATDDDASAAHQLLTRAAEIVATDYPADAALTVYGADGTPVAPGRAGPSELLADSLQRGEAWFPTPVAQGLRLVYVQPVMNNGVRVGTIAVERPLPSVASASGTSSLQGTDDDAYRVPTTLAPVSIQLPFEGAPPAGDSATFDVQAPSGERLLTASVSPDDLANTRERVAAGDEVGRARCHRNHADPSHRTSARLAQSSAVAIDLWVHRPARHRLRRRDEIHVLPRRTSGLVRRAGLLRHSVRVGLAGVVALLPIRFPADSRRGPSRLLCSSCTQSRRGASIPGGDGSHPWAPRV
jgi:hypothetical protein